MSELGPEARSILEGGRSGDDPTPEDRARIRASVMRAIAAGGALGAATVASEATAAGGLSLGWKVLAVLVVVGAVGAGTIATRQQASAPVQASVATVVGSPEPPVVRAPSLPVDVAAPPAPSPPAAETTAAPSAPARAAVPRQQQPQEPRVAAEPASPAAPATAGPSPPPDTLAAETQRLREAHGALTGGEASRALALLDEESAAGPQLREERAAARVLVLCQLGRVDEARLLAARFLAESPRSPLADRVRASCAGR